MFFFKLISTFFSTGYIKPASATWGSLAGAIALYFWFPNLTIWQQLLTALAIFLIGWWATQKHLNKTGDSDPHYIVVDEVAAMALVLVAVPQTPLLYFIAFVLFRIFDIAKLWPASYFDKKHSAFSTMFDDSIMAIPAWILLAIIQYIWF